jgi:hypothetical protein
MTVDLSVWPSILETAETSETADCAENFHPQTFTHFSVTDANFLPFMVNGGLRPFPDST